MSGGVDSSITAALLVKHQQVNKPIHLIGRDNLPLKAHKMDISAVFMRNWDTRDESGSDVGCEWEKDWEDVRRVCRHIGVPCEMVSPIAPLLVTKRFIQPPS